MYHNINTGLDSDKSKLALSEAFKVYSEKYGQYNPHFSWKNDRLAVFGFKTPVGKMEGKLLVQDGEIIIDMTVPLLARAFQKTAVEIIDKEVQIWVERIKNSSEINNG